jgi:hypothetical protein
MEMPRRGFQAIAPITDTFRRLMRRSRTKQKKRHIMEMYRVDSSAMRAVGYDEAARRMRIVFAQGNTHDYCDVPRDIFESLMDAKSKGSYFNQAIKNKYEC